MNERQKAFAEAYAASANATEAAKAAGYSQRTAYSHGARLLKDDEVVAYIRELQESSASARIASVTQIRAFWSDVLNNPGEKTVDRLRASELLAKSAGMFLNLRADDGGAGGRMVTGEYSGEDVVIVLPDNHRDPDIQQFATPDEIEKFGGIQNVG